jgi:glucokinase
LKLLFDIGGTKLRRGVLNDRGEFVLLDDRLSKGDLKAKLEALIAETIKRYPIDFIGASFAGQTQNNRLFFAPNIELGALKNEDFSDWIFDRFSIKAAIDNDLKCAAIAEAAARSTTRTLFALFVGTGIGGACVENGAIGRGANNNAGEIGHIPFEKTPFLCGCGGADCLEASASGSAIAKWSERYGFQARTIAELSNLDNPKAAEILDRFHRGIDYAVRTIIALFNPDTIVLGGGVALSCESALIRAKNAAQNAFKPSRRVTIELSSLGDKANLLGAALLDADLSKPKTTR